MVSPLFSTIVLFAAFVFIYMKITTKKLGSGTENFLEREARANSVRKQPLDTLDYVDFTVEKLPDCNSVDNERKAELMGSLAGLSSLKIVNLSGISNTDLKLQYGPANLPLLTEYDQNYTLLVTDLNELGSIMLEGGDKECAQKIFEYAVSIGTDISSTYILLANIYIEKGNAGLINGLITSIESTRSLTRGSTAAKLQEILDSNTAMVIPLSSDSSKESDDPGSILPADILDILETAPYRSDDQK